jgi:hypothetical protein
MKAQTYREVRTALESVFDDEGILKKSSPLAGRRIYAAGPKSPAQAGRFA